MAGTLRPNLEYLREAKYHYLGGITYANAGKGLIDGATGQAWTSPNVAYFNGSTTHVIFKFDETVSIWRLGHSSYPEYTSPFEITKLNEETGKYEAVNITQLPLTNDATAWQKFAINIPKGVYKFSYISYRMDNEWFFEGHGTTKSFIFNNGKYLKWALPSTSRKSLIPTMFDYTVPSGETFSSSNSATWFNWYAFMRDDSKFWLSNNVAFPHFLGYKFSKETIVNAYSIRARNYDANDLITAPNTWIFQGSNDGVTWYDIDSRSQIVFKSKGEELLFKLKDRVSYKSYRLYITAHNGYSTPQTAVAKFSVYNIDETITEDKWVTVTSSFPTKEQFLNDGMDELKVFDRVPTVYKPLQMDLNTKDVLGFDYSGRGKVFTKSLDLTKEIYMDIRKLEVIT